MKIILNGEEKSLSGPMTVASLLEEIGAHGRIAVEINHEIIPRSVHDTHRLRDQDRVEVVRAIGGG